MSRARAERRRLLLCAPRVADAIERRGMCHLVTISVTSDGVEDDFACILCASRRSGIRRLTRSSGAGLSPFMLTQSLNAPHNSMTACSCWKFEDVHHELECSFIGVVAMITVPQAARPPCPGRGRHSKIGGGESRTHFSIFGDRPYYKRTVPQVISLQKPMHSQSFSVPREQGAPEEQLSGTSEDDLNLNTGP